MRRVLLASLVSLLWFIGVEKALAWDFAGHFVIGAIAYQQLDPPVRAEAERLIKILAAAEPAVSEFVPATAWLDAQNWNPDFGLMQDWHFAGLSYPPGGLLRAGRMAEVTVTALKTLSGPRSTDFQKALMLRVLIHTVGDMHQPLHAINYSSAEHPGGDEGGHAFALQGPYPNLHALWDAAGGQYPYLRFDQWRQALPLAQAIQSEFPVERFGARPPNLPAFLADFLANSERWIDESYLIALTTAYHGIEPNQTPSPAYLDQVRAASRRQLALAGYRLAQLLNASLGTSHQGTANKKPAPASAQP